ncbi:MAG: alpha-1,2-fucosyltransferase [Prevotella sp.]|nr:alpha-1,2-fucosyltransferase [Prevotella sp.]
MIAVNIHQGLANQMFHYAFGRGLEAKGLDICFDQTNYKPAMPHEFIRLQDAFPHIEIRPMPKGRFRLVYLSPEERKKIKDHRLAFFFPRLLRKLGIEKYIFEKRYAYSEGMEKFATGNCIYRGHWQSEKYFIHCADDIRRQFSFLPFDEPRNKSLARQMANEHSVSIHLRKSPDYVESKVLGCGICDVDYYQNAIDYIRQYVAHPVFYVFTDNHQWVAQNMRFLKDFTVVDWNPVSGPRSFRDMQLMSCCCHNIIANSTYSWWGAWLNPNPRKIVVAPKTYCNPINTFFAEQDILPDEWIKI